MISTNQNINTEEKEKISPFWIKMLAIVFFILSFFLLFNNMAAQVVIDNTSSVLGVSSGTTVNVSHETGSDDNRLMLVGISCRTRTPSSVTYDGVDLEAIGTLQPSTGYYVYIYRYIAPPSGTANVTVVFSGSLGSSTRASVGVMTFSNVSQSNPTGTVETNFTSTNNNSPTLSIPSTTSQLMFNVVTAAGANINSMGDNQTSQWTYSGAVPRSAGSTKPGEAGSTTVSYTLASNTLWSIIGVGINPAPVSDLQVNKVVDNGTPAVDQVIYFTITATNNGPDVADNVVVNDVLPAGYTFLGSTVSTGTYDSNSGIWDIGQMSNSASETLVIEAIVLGAGPYLNTATISGNVVDNTSGNNTSSVNITICNSSPRPPLFSN